MIKGHQTIDKKSHEVVFAKLTFTIADDTKRHCQALHTFKVSDPHSEVFLTILSPKWTRCVNIQPSFEQM